MSVVPRLRSAAAAVAALAGVAMLSQQSACGGGLASTHLARPTGLRARGLRAPDDLTVHPARLFPETLDEASLFGHEPGRGARAIVSGLRITASPEGPMYAAADRFPATPTSVVELPERMGGGFLFGLGKALWRAPSWLEPASPVFASTTPIAQVLVGLDRAYVRSAQGALTALDPRSGAITDLGPLPASPSVGRLAALDAWRAVAIADLRGALVTLDAGSTWRPLALPIDANDVVPLESSIAVGGTDENHQAEWWEVRPDGQVGRLGAAPGSEPHPVDVAAPAADPLTRAFGARPLVAAIEDGWPLVDGTALVARDGAIARVRMSDGALVESSADAFPLKPARCHPLALARPGDPGAFGFVCGEPRGRTALYRWDARAAQLVEMRRWDSPREVLASGNGAIAVRGPCDASSEPASPAAPTQGKPRARDTTPDEAYCLFVPGAGWSESHVRGEEADRARIVVLSDGRIALVRPPRSGELVSARVTLVDGGRTTDVAVAWPQLKPEVARVLRFGTWMDGFEERRPGVLGGWVDGAGTVLGIELGVDGEARIGEYIHDAGAPLVSGRWGLGWTASRRGFETTDGGMTWKKDIEVPEPIAPARSVRERACGPVGCIAAGWLRVGWGATETSAPPAEAPLRSPRPHVTRALDLDCQTVAARLPESKPSSPARVFAPPPPPGWPFRPSPGPRLGPSPNGYGTLSEFPPCLGHPGPPLPASDRGIPPAEAGAALERSMRATSPLACLYAWGPMNGDWDQLGRWEVRWLSPWGGAADVRATAAVAAPWPSQEAARRAFGQAGGQPTMWVLAPGDDADHALLVARRTLGTPSADVVMLESDKAPVEVRRPGGDPFPDVEGATRAAGRWYIATSQSAGELAATVVWLLDGGTAREIARLPRVALDGEYRRAESRGPTRLARRTDGRAVGVLVDGQPDALRGTTTRWVAGIDLESGAVSDPEALAPTDLSDREVSLCSGDDTGWSVDLPYSGAVRVHGGGPTGMSLQSTFARLRLTRDHACIDRVLGSTDVYPEGFAGTTSPAPRPDARTVDATVIAGRTRYSLRCSKR
jgi:hypothetical protein